MRKNIWSAILLIGMLGLVAQAAVTISTATGNGADTFVGNDSNKGPTTNFGGLNSIDIRNIPASRAHIGYMRFDFTSAAGNLKGAQLQLDFNSSGGVRTLNVYGLTDNAVDDAWNETAVTYNDIPGMIQTIPQASGDYTIDATKLTLLGTLATPSAGAMVTSSTETLNLDSFIASDTNGLMTLVFISTDTSGKQYYISTKEYAATDPLRTAPRLILPNAVVAAITNPQPIGGAVLDKNTITQLNWSLVAGLGTYKCDVYLGTEPNVPQMAKVTFNPAVGSVNINNFPGFSTPLNEGTYYWRVDCYNDPNHSATEPNLPGRFWKFTATSVPLFTLQPVEQIKFVGETAEFTVAVTSSTTPVYTWYRSTDNVNNTSDDDVSAGTNSPTLTLTNLTGVNEGYYYCKVTNSGGSTYSNTANLGVKRQVAYWTLDALVGGKYADSSGEGHSADPNGTPVFVTGAGATTGNGIVIDTINGYASSGTWNPSVHTDQLSFSLWAKWAGQTTVASWQGLIAKANSFGAATMMWQLEIDATNNSVAYKNGSSTAITTPPLPVGEWVNLTVTFNNTTATIYRNGETGNSGAVAFSAKTDSNVNIGATAKSDAGLFSSFFNGVLDDIHMYNYALTQTQVIDLYHTVSGQSICTNRPTYDLSGDCLVNMADFAIVARNWLECGLYPLCP